MTREQPRHPPGTPRGGQWAPTGHSEPEDLVLAPSGVRPEIVAEVTQHPNDPNVEVLWDATLEEIDWVLEHGTDDHVVAIAGRPDLTREQNLKILDSSRPVSARIECVAKMSPGVAEKASYDPSPVVRAHALAFGWDLSEERKRALRADPETMRMMAALNLEPLDD